MSTHYFRFPSRGWPPQHRAPSLERLLARAAGPTETQDWREEAFRVIASESAVAHGSALAQGSAEVPRSPAAPVLGAMPDVRAIPGLGAVAMIAAGGPPAAGWVFFATPVHYVAEMSNVRLAPEGVLTLAPEQAMALAVDFERVWRDAGVRLWPAASGQLFCIVDSPVPAVTVDPQELLDRHLQAYLPSGIGGARLRRLMSEIEMWLFDHEINRQRSAAGALPVSGLWLWGGGAVLTELPAVNGWTVGHDPFFSALSATRADWGGENSAVIVAADAPGTEGWRAIDASWLQPAIEQLRSGRLTRIELSAGVRSFAVTAARSWRFWRPLRPWWEYFE